MSGLVLALHLGRGAREQCREVSAVPPPEGFVALRFLSSSNHPPAARCAPIRRKVYDQTGSVDDAEELAGDKFNDLYNYYRSLYVKVHLGLAGQGIQRMQRQLAIHLLTAVAFDQWPSWPPAQPNPHSPTSGPTSKPTQTGD